MRHDLEQAAGWLLAFGVREAIRYPWPSAVVGLLAVIWVLRKLPRDARSIASSAEPNVVVVRTGMGLLGIGVIAAVGYYVIRGHATTPKAAPAPTPTITQKVLHPTIVQHITHVAAAPGHTGLYVLIVLYVLAGSLVLAALLRFLARMGS